MARHNDYMNAVAVEVVPSLTSPAAAFAIEARQMACTNYFPGDPYDNNRSCASCGDWRQNHVSDPEMTEREVLEKVMNLLDHYGHHCTVQNLLPQMARTLGYDR